MNVSPLPAPSPPLQSWNPMWSVGTILTGLLSFMYDTQVRGGGADVRQTYGRQMAGVGSVRQAVGRAGRGRSGTARAAAQRWWGSPRLGGVLVLIWRGRAQRSRSQRWRCGHRCGAPRPHPGTVVHPPIHTRHQRPIRPGHHGEHHHLARGEGAAGSGEPGLQRQEPHLQEALPSLD